MQWNARAVKVIFAAFSLAGFIYLINASWLAPPPEGQPTVISHRGVYQTYKRENLGRDDCTAVRIFEPEHQYLENSTASIEAAFTYGADIVEIDIHPTTDREFAVFHDWTLDCRTEGTGITRQHSMKYLKTLDIGYGYTFDDGETFPFRGKGVGQIMTLEEVYRAFPGKRFLINIKSNNPAEADQLNHYLASRKLPVDAPLLAYGGAAPVERLRQLRPDALVFSRASVKKCVIKYLAFGWSGLLPQECKNSIVLAPNTWQWAYWGWPNRFSQRIKDAGSLVMALDYSDGQSGMPGIYNPHQLEFLPADYNGALWVEKIELVGPAARQKFARNER